MVEWEIKPTLDQGMGMKTSNILPGATCEALLVCRPSWWLRKSGGHSENQHQIDPTPHGPSTQLCGRY